LLIGFTIISIVPALRGIFALSPLGLLEVGLITVALLLWLFLVRFFWRRRIIARFLGVKMA